MGVIQSTVKALAGGGFPAAFGARGAGALAMKAINAPSHTA
jgi:hypothetical protein